MSSRRNGGGSNEAGFQPATAVRLTRRRYERALLPQSWVF